MSRSRQKTVGDVSRRSCDRAESNTEGAIRTVSDIGLSTSQGIVQQRKINFGSVELVLI
jgi:hypothetical protein